MYYLHNAQTYQYMGEVMAILEMLNKQPTPPGNSDDYYL